MNDKNEFFGMLEAKELIDSRQFDSAEDKLVFILSLRYAVAGDIERAGLKELALKLIAKEKIDDLTVQWCKNEAATFQKFSEYVKREEKAKGKKIDIKKAQRKFMWAEALKEQENEQT
jgi:hypothetical protein